MPPISLWWPLMPWSFLLPRRLYDSSPRSHAGDVPSLCVSRGTRRHRQTGADREGKRLGRAATLSVTDRRDEHECGNRDDTENGALHD